jgi:DNA-binding SARP family transcriptional activator/tetratricopeptide (TPR) repeat protein
MAAPAARWPPRRIGFGGRDTEFRLLGSLEVRRDGQRIELAGRRQRVLLAVLLLRRNQVLSADVLTEHLWGDQPPASAAALQMQISRLRRALGPEPERAVPRLLTRAPGYVLHAADDELDVVEFERLWTLGHHELAAGRCGVAASVLRRALALQRGPALADFLYDEFAQASISRLGELLLVAVEDRIEADLALHAHGTVLPELEMLVQQEPLRERLSGLLMLALYRSGRQADAIRAYERLERRLEDELGVRPSPDLRRLAQAVRVQDPDLSAGPRPATQPGPERQEPIRSSPSGRPPEIQPAGALSGRSRELAAIVAHLDATWAGAGRLVLLVGEAGIGKTRLAEEVAAAARGRGAFVGWARCHEGRGAPPYWPWRQIVGAYVAGYGVEALRAAAGARAPDLAPLLAELDESGAGAPGPPAADPDAVRFRMFETLAAALGRVAAATPVVLIVDDLQWADVASLRFLEHLVRQLHGMAVLVLGAYRATGLGHDHPLTGTLGDVVRLTETSRIHLDGLDEPACAELIAAVSGAAPASLVTALQRKTNGNPFFINELIHLLHAEGRLAGSAGEEGWSVGVPPAVREVVARRCAALSECARQVLSAGSVIGREFDLDVVTQVIPGLDVGLVEAVEDLVAAGFVGEMPRHAGRYRFSHDIVRDTLYLEQSVLRRARLHGRVGEALERSERRPLPPAAELADHFCIAADAGGDRARAVRHCLRAAADATHALAYEAAVWHCQRALAVVDRTTTADVRSRRSDVLLQLGDALWRAGEVRQAHATFIEAAELAHEEGRWEALVEALVGFGGGTVRDWHPSREPAGARLVALLQEALRRAARGDSGQRVRLLGRLAEELYYADEVERRLQLGAAAVEMARRLDDRPSLVSALCSRCITLWDPDHLEERHRTALEVVSAGDDADDRELRLFGRHYLYVAQLEIGDGEGARSTLDVFQTIAAELRQPLYLWEARWLAALQALVEGAWDEAERLAVTALGIGQQTGDLEATAIFAVQMGAVRLEQGRIGEVAGAVDAMADEYAAWPAWRAGQALVAAELGRPDDAERRFDALAADGFANITRDFAWLAAIAMLALTCSYLRDAERAGDLYRLLLPFADRNVVLADRSYWGSASHYLGLLAAVCERWTEAEDHFRASEGMNRRMGAAPWVGHTLYEHARMLGGRGGPGDRERARHLMAEAGAIARSLGMARLADRVAATSYA